ncbi:MAG: DNA polymerase Y family protein, partial [Emticicia sp.]|uniref:DNA polymerase Y family protein n=1 Tax=Emticicia sp. TaxID=1930953 RepID=UPI003BA40B27
MEKNIVHFDLDAFYVSVERLKNPLLLNKPVIVGGISDRGVVAACSYEARKFGIHSAMSSVMAKRLCPDAIFIKGDYESYTQYSDMVTQIISDRVPVLEKASIDEFYVDLSGMEKYFGCLKYSTQIKNEICKETGLSISFGLASNKTVSKVATNEVKPNGQCHILAGNEKAFLRPLSVSKLPMVGSVTGQTLRNMGIQNIGSLAEMPRKMLESVFGKNGITLWERANGLDNTPIEPYHDKKSISKEI